MNKEEMFKNLSDKDKKEVLRLMSFMKKIKEQDRKKELYATYEEYLDLIHISEHLSNENELLQSQLDTANKKLEETKEYINKNIRHEYRNGRNNEFYLELNENKLKQLQSIIGSD